MQERWTDNGNPDRPDHEYICTVCPDSIPPVAMKPSIAADPTGCQPQTRPIVEFGTRRNHKFQCFTARNCLEYQSQDQLCVCGTSHNSIVLPNIVLTRNRAENCKKKRQQKIKTTRRPDPTWVPSSCPFLSLVHHHPTDTHENTTNNNKKQKIAGAEPAREKSRKMRITVRARREEQKTGDHKGFVY